ncbi:MAG: OsmC family protein [Spirochaetales bacterium]|nr:OsmC family protein [Spirochaetales bacterium]
MPQSISCAWTDEMTFTAVVDGHSLVLDADEAAGGRDKGPRPKKLILAALAGCTGMDVIYMLKKMKIRPAFFNILVDADLAETDPKFYIDVRVRFQFAEADRQYASNIEKAVKLSQEKYCGVAAQLKAGAKVSYEIEYLADSQA